MKLHELPSPLGPLQVAFTRSGALTYLGFADHEPRTGLLAALAQRAAELDPHPRLDDLQAQLEAYFGGHLHTFDVHLDLRGTPFQQRVWSALQAIPFGETRTYGQLAATLGDPERARAVGAANGANPVSILVPCHRLVGLRGLTGYAGGIARKQALLDLEKAHGS